MGGYNKNKRETYVKVNIIEFNLLNDLMSF